MRRPDLVTEFSELAATWQKEMTFSSSITEIAMHPAYQRIVGMGPAALPLILRELEHQPHHWFWALKAITGADPVKPEDRGRIQRMAEAWLQWAKEEGLKW